MVESSQFEFTKLDTLVLHKNVDRVLRIRDNIFLVASYHLDKETGTKSGNLVVVEVDIAKKK